MENKKEMTIPNVSAATDAEQSLSKCTDNSISEKAGKINDLETMGVANRALEKIYKRKRDFARLVS